MISEAHWKLLDQNRSGYAERRSLSDLHDRFDSEAPDESWSYYAEQYLRDYLAIHAPSPQFDIVAIECRTTLCEIRAFGYTDTAQRDWNRIVATMGQQPWWTEFTGNSSASSANNGQAVILTLLHRRPAP